MKISPHDYRKARADGAFSLIEVTMALGILSFCILTAVGLLPVALTTMRSAMDSTIDAQIVQQIASEANLTAFDRLDAFVSSGPIYFDEEGQRTNVANESRFKVSLRKLEVGAIKVFPGANQANRLPDNLYLVESVISDARKTADSVISTHVIYVPNSGG